MNKEKSKMGTVVTSPEGAVIRHGKGIESVRMHIERAGEHARSLGTTLVPMRQVADDYLREIESQHLGDGLEVIEEPKIIEPLVALHEQAAVRSCLEKLADTPVIRKRPTNVWVVETNYAGPVEALFAQAERALGFKPTKPQTRVHTESAPATPEPKKRWWSK
jgi:hypothetical protein